MLTALAILAIAAVAFTLYIKAMRQRDLEAMTDSELHKRAEEVGNSDPSYQRELQHRRAELVFHRNAWEKN